MSEQGRSNRALFLKTLTDLGVGEKTARGAIGSLGWESGVDLNPISNNKGDGADGSDSIGVGQWNSTRAAALKSTAAALGLPWQDPRAQAAHMRNELLGSHKNVLDALKQKDDMLYGADVWTNRYEVPKVRNVQERYQRAVQMASLDGSMAPPASAPGPVEPIARPFSDHTATDVWTPPIDATPEQRLAQREADAARIAETPWSTVIKDAYSTSSISGSILRAGSLGGFEPDNDYRMSAEELTQRTTNLAPDYHEWFQSAVSKEHADAIQASAEQHQASSIRLQEQGWSGTAAQVGAMILDPPAIAFGAATGGIGMAASRAAQAGKLAHVGIEAAAGAASNVALDAGLRAGGDPEHRDLVTTALMGAALGAGIGMLSRAPGAERLNRAARRDLQEVIGPTQPREIIDDPNGPRPDRPEVIRPTDPAAPRRTGDPTIDRAIERNDEWEAIDRADELFRRRLAGRERPMDEVRPSPRPGPGEPPTVPPKPVERPMGPNEVETNVLNESSATRTVAQYVEALAAKLGITGAISVTDIRKTPNWDGRTFGFAQPLSRGNSVVVRLAVNPTLPKEMLLDTINHEFGHVYDMHSYGMRLYKGQFNAEGGAVNAHPELKEAWKKWASRAQKQSREEFFREYLTKSQRPHFDNETRNQTTLYQDTVTRTHFKYQTSHQEWLAQEWAKEFASNPAKHGTVGKFFGDGVAAIWRRLYYVATGNLPEGVPSKVFQDWLKGRYNEAAVPAKRLGAEAESILQSASEGAYNVEDLQPIGEAVIFPGRPTLAAGTGLGGVGQSEVARTALGGVRFSIAGVLGRSDNPAVRALGGLLVEDNVGKQGGAVNPHSAELYARRKTNASVVAIAQARKPAIDKWAEENGYGFFERKRREGEFEALVAEAMRLPSTSPEYQNLPQWAKQYASHLNKVADEVREFMNNPLLDIGEEARPVDGFGAVKGDEKYLMRVWSPKKISDLVNTPGGYAKMQSLITNAIIDAQPDLEPELAQKLGEGFTREVYKRAHGVIDEKAARMFAIDNLESVKWDLVNRYGLNEDDASRVTNKLRKGSDAHADPRAKRRIMMNEQYEENGLKLQDLLVNNATALTTAYAKHGWGKVALARLRMTDDEGNVVLNGVTNDGDWNAALNAIRAKGHDNGVSHLQTEREIQALQVAYDRILGVPTPHQNERWAKIARTVGKLNLLRLGHQFTFAQAGETYNMLAGISLGALAKQSPSFRRIVTADARWVKANELDRWIENVFGLGADGLRLVADSHHADDLHSLPLEAVGFWDDAQQLATTASNNMLRLSGFHFVDGMMKQWTAKAIAQEFFDHAYRLRTDAGGNYDLTKLNINRMRQLGLSDDLLQRVFKSLKQHGAKEQGVLTNVKLVNPNVDKWVDQEARIAFESAVFRKARQIIQENDVGSMHQWMPHPVWQMITQFRAFPIHAYDKQLMLNLAMHDTTSMNALWLGAAIPTLIYAVQQHLNALGRSDAGEWLDKRLDTQHLVTAAIQRHGWSSLLPTAVDTALPFFGTKPIFNARNTGQQSDLLFGNPTASFVTDTSKAVGGLMESFRSGRRLSQDELRDWHRLFGNNLVSGAILNSMIGDRPVHPPKPYSYH